MADKSNAMPSGHALWQRVFKQGAAEFPAINALHLYVDALAMLLVTDPGQFQVIVTNNLFGDIVTDIGAALQGDLGMAASNEALDRWRELCTHYAGLECDGCKCI